MKSIALVVACFAVIGCGTHYPHDPFPCTSDSQCASGQQCISEWTHTDAGDCLSDHKICKKPCSTDGDCSYCGTFGICAKDACDTTGPSTCGDFCGDGK
ncbi:MAG: hypothetical protein ACJ790_12090 [Myxococcaceae bacterium]